MDMKTVIIFLKMENVSIVFGMEIEVHIYNH